MVLTLLWNSLVRSHKRLHSNRVQVSATSGVWKYADHTFVLGNESTNYVATFGPWSGNAGDAISVNNGVNTLSYSTGQPFTTKDRDNDMDGSQNLAVVTGGGFWYSYGAAARITFCSSCGGGFAWYGRGGVTYTSLLAARTWLICV